MPIRAQGKNDAWRIRILLDMHNSTLSLWSVKDADHLSMCLCLECRNNAQLFSLSELVSHVIASLKPLCEVDSKLFNLFGLV